MDLQETKKIEAFALRIRMAALEAIHSIGSGHVGGVMSISDTLAVLYGREMRFNPADPKWADRDYLVVSKGHAGPAVYATLALKGFFPEEELMTLNQPGTNLPSHCDMNKTPGIDMTTGSLGQGTSEAVGLALGDKLLGRDCRTYLLVGDGEANEGQVWEAAMFTAAKELTNLVWLIDWNKKQLDGPLDDILKPFDFEEKFRAFGFDACTIDGNDVAQVKEALSKKAGDRPIAIILDTVKGKGVTEVENTAGNHSMAVGPEVFDSWIAELQSKLDALGA